MTSTCPLPDRIEGVCADDFFEIIRSEAEHDADRHF